ncbi:MAG TPA: thioredoxin family protein [Candidatus Krumholzibacteria bacterium]|nr:thioredoxin family protein [Candidatus Krumholzibacteria bacterium]HPD70620.1 thioredoxin family protein [Candidatus Krumholzibacteria bacterium]HRY39680.1 thioredoxin family protein [Candidatus Krumholzibacteria bacterium]
MKIVKILGTGCPKCTKLAELTKQAAGELALDYQLEKITDLNAIMSHGVMMTPALVVDGEVKSVGKVPSLDEIKRMLS